MGSRCAYKDLKVRASAVRAAGGTQAPVWRVATEDGAAAAALGECSPFCCALDGSTPHRHTHRGILCVVGLEFDVHLELYKPFLMSTFCVVHPEECAFSVGRSVQISHNGWESRAWAYKGAPI